MTDFFEKNRNDVGSAVRRWEVLVFVRSRLMKRDNRRPRGVRRGTCTALLLLNVFCFAEGWGPHFLPPASVQLRRRVPQRTLKHVIDLQCPSNRLCAERRRRIPTPWEEAHGDDNYKELAPPFHSRGVARHRQRHSSSREAKTPAAQQQFVNDDSRDLLDAALCIVPPDAAWDTLQRARHVARDVSAAVWPPCLRLFHPVAGLDALKVAQVVEKYRIEPFPIRLSQWAVIPHLEAMEEMERRMVGPDDGVASATSTPGWGGSRTDDNSDPVDADRAEIEALIDREERRGRINKARREEKRRLKQREDDVAPAATSRTDASTESPRSPPEVTPSNATTGRSLLQQQQEMYEEFNGPCVVCLEPDDESKARLLELRDLLRNELFGPDFVDAYSPTATAAGPGRGLAVDSSLRNRWPQRYAPPAGADPTTPYRPLVSIGAFPTVSEAIRMARKLRNLWSPLTFDVTDLQLVSLSSSDHGHHYDPYRGKVQVRQVGCDAIVMLVGQEIEVDPDESQDMARLLCERGENGGADPIRSPNTSRTHGSVARPMEPEADKCPILDLLDDDDDDIDEGTVVVIGRTHFFTGEMRLYVGMPATSTSELQFSQSSSSDSALSRRRGAVHHQRRQDGRFGQAMAEDDLDDDLSARFADNDCA